MTSKLLSPRPRIHHCRTHWWGVTLVKLSSCCVFPGLTFPRSMGLLTKILVTSCCFFAWLLFNFSIPAFLLKKKTFSNLFCQSLIPCFMYVLFLGKKNCFHGTAVNLRSPNSPTSHLRWANHQLSFLITLFGRWGCFRKIHGEMLEDKFNPMFVWSLWFVCHEFFWKICHQLVDIWSPSVDLVGLDDLFFPHGSVENVGSPKPVFPWKAWLISTSFQEL